jgi:hypothetical protein
MASSASLSNLILSIEVHLLTILLHTGLGNMGFHMAQNLSSKLPAGSTLIVCEIVEATLKRFVAETKDVKTAANPKEVAERSVSWSV